MAQLFLNVSFVTLLIRHSSWCIRTTVDKWNIVCWLWENHFCFDVPLGLVSKGTSIEVTLILLFGTDVVLCWQDELVSTVANFYKSWDSEINMTYVIDVLVPEVCHFGNIYEDL